MGTLFTSVYDRFLNKITDDMYMELTPQDTEKDMEKLLINAIPGFEFPKKSLATSTDENGLSCFEVELDGEEENILAILMLIGWLQRQIASVENVNDYELISEIEKKYSNFEEFEADFDYELEEEYAEIDLSELEDALDFEEPIMAYADSEENIDNI